MFNNGAERHVLVASGCYSIYNAMLKSLEIFLALAS